MSSTPERFTPSFTPLTPEELARRYEKLRERAAKGPIYAVHRNPQMHVRWVHRGYNNKENVDISQDISNHRHMGYEFAKDDPNKPEEERLIDTVVGISLDGQYRTGDVVLMQIDRASHDYYHACERQASRDMLSGTKANFKNEAALQGVEAFEFERDKYGNKIDQNGNKIT